MKRVASCLLGVLVALGVIVVSAAGGSIGREQAQGTIVTVAGTGTDGATGDGGPATAAAINHPRGLAVLADGSFVFAQPFVPMVRRVAPDGTISTVVGTGDPGYNGDGGIASLATLDLAHGVAALPDGGFLVADMGNNRIRRVWPDGRITTVVGNGVRGYAGDGGPATSASIALPRGVAALPNGELLIPDTTNARVRQVSPDGIITTVAGTGLAGFSGDGGLATAAQLNRPFSIAPLPGGGFLVADLDNNRIRRVAKDGTITTVAGTGEAAFSGDGGPARAAALNQPHCVLAVPAGGFLIADTYNHRVRRVWPDGRITTVAGTGVPGFLGDGGPAAEAQLNFPKALAILPDLSGFLVGDAANNRVRLVRLQLRVLELRLRVPITPSIAGDVVKLRYSVSEPAVVRLVVSRGSRVVVQKRASAPAGTGAFFFGRQLSPGLYALRLSAATRDGRSARAVGSLRLLP